MERIVRLISVKKPILVGSSADPEIKYSADYDYMEDVEYSSKNIDTFVNHVSKLHPSEIQDIKIGEISEWNLLRDVEIKTKVIGYSQIKELEHLELLKNGNLISQEEYKLGKKLLKKNLSPVQFIEAQKELRFGLLRWTRDEVLAKEKKLRDGKVVSIYTACKSGITKIDVVALLDKYTEFSNIIFWKPYSSPKDTIKNDILVYLNDNNYLKVLKRIYSINKTNQKSNHKLLPILNSDLGLLYVLISNIETLESINKPVNKKLQEIRNELVRVNIPKLKIPKKLSFKSIPYLKAVLNNETRLKMKRSGLLPLSKTYLP